MQGALLCSSLQRMPVASISSVQHCDSPPGKSPQPTPPHCGLPAALTQPVAQHTSALQLARGPGGELPSPSTGGSASVAPSADAPSGVGEETAPSIVRSGFELPAPPTGPEAEASKVGALEFPPGAPGLSSTTAHEGSFLGHNRSSIEVTEQLERAAPSQSPEIPIRVALKEERRRTRKR